MVALKINTDRKPNAALMKRYGVEGIPAIIFVDPKGKKVHEFVGYKPPDEFAQDMQTALKRAGLKDTRPRAARS